MGRITLPPPAKLIIGFIFQNKDSYDKALLPLEKKFGSIDFQSPILGFNYTDYYKEEFGDGLNKKFISFKKLIPAQQLPQIKIFANKLEEKFSFGGKRLVNIDPGCLTLAKLVLATTKDYAHRIYLGKGIFAEVTLFYEKNSFEPGKWTYRDYQTKDYKQIFNQIRDIYAQQIKLCHCEGE
ncbi:MAG: DUF4416 family protein [Candidatus Omnitrophota bacterium]